MSFAPVLTPEQRGHSGVNTAQKLHAPGTATPRKRPALGYCGNFTTAIVMESLRTAATSEQQRIANSNDCYTSLSQNGYGTSRI
jgi:hypothetical protein